MVLPIWRICQSLPWNQKCQHPQGSLMDLWDTPFSTNTSIIVLHHLGDYKCKTHESKTTETDYFFLSFADLPDADDDSYAEFNTILPSPVLSLTKVVASPSVVGLESSPSISFTISKGKLVDTGGNLNMTNRLDSFVSVVSIKPIMISMATKGTNSTYQHALIAETSQYHCLMNLCFTH